MSAKFRPDPNFARNLGKAAAPAVKKAQARLNEGFEDELRACVARRGAKTDEQVIAELAVVVRNRGAQPNLENLRRWLSENGG